MDVSPAVPAISVPSLPWLESPAPIVLFWLGYALVLLVPGPNMVVIAGLAAVKGVRGAVPLVLGITLGSSVLAALVFTGAEGLATHPLLVQAGRWAGFALLVWVAWRLVRSPPRVPRPVRRHRIVAGEFGAGLVTAGTNPVTASYFLAAALGWTGARGAEDLVLVVASVGIATWIRSLLLALIAAAVAMRGGAFRPPRGLRVAAAAGLLVIGLAGMRPL